MKRNFFIQLTLGFIMEIIYILVLYYNGLLEDFCFDLTGCSLVLAISFIKIFLLFTLVTSIWLTETMKLKSILILISSLLLFSAMVFSEDSFLYSPFIFSIILLHLIYINVFETNINHVVIGNVLILLLSFIMYLTFDEFLFGIPYSLAELDISGNRFDNFMMISATLFFLITIVAVILKYKKFFQKKDSILSKN